MKPTLSIEKNGTKLWELNGEIHNEDGPAVEYPSGKKEYYLNDRLYETKEQWQEELDKRKDFDTMSESERCEVLNEAKTLINEIENICDKKLEYENLIRDLSEQSCEIRWKLDLINKRHKLDTMKIWENERTTRDSARNNRRRN